MPSFSRKNALDQFLDIKGSTTVYLPNSVSEESSGLGIATSGLSGSGLSVDDVTAGVVTVSGLSGMTPGSVGSYLTIKGAATGANNGTFAITAYVSASSVKFANVSAVSPDANNGLIEWRSDTFATISAVAGGIATATGLANMTANSVGNFITISGAATGGNNGTFLITEYVSATSVKYANSSAVFPDANSGSLAWVERSAYTLESDMNYERKDRALIKGVNYDAAVPTYVRPTATNQNVPKSLNNLISLDSKLLNTNRIAYNQSVASTNTLITVSSAGNLKHASVTDLTGVPCFDVAPYVGDYTSCYVFITNTADGAELEVLAGAHKGERVFGVTQNGGSTSPNSVEVAFYSVPSGGNPTTSATAYTWEAGQPTSINLTYGFGEVVSAMNVNSLRSTQALGVVSDADLRQDIYDIQSTIGMVDNDTSLVSHLTNTGNYFPFVNLGTATPTAVDALNTLNAQIGDRAYTGTALDTIVAGETITASIQKLAAAVAASNVTRYIERLAVDAPANVAHTLPGSATFTPDGTGNGVNLYVYWRGVLRDPGSVAAGDDYSEGAGPAATQITPFSKILAGDHINYFILQ